LAPISQHLEDRVAEIAAGKFDAELEEINGMNDDELHRRYAEREIEPAY
jgi:hypothetical protein